MPKTYEEMRADSAALDDWAKRVARNDPDWTIYWPWMEPPGKLSWWRRFVRAWRMDP